MNRPKIDIGGATGYSLDRILLGPLKSAGLLFAVVLVVLLSGLTIDLPGSFLVFVDVGIFFLLYGLLVLGLNLQYGYTGLVNFGHVVFFAVGGYATAILVAESAPFGVSYGLPWPIGIVAGVVAAALLGAIVGVSTLRLREDFLALATLATAEIFHDVIGTFRSVTGGNIGILKIPQPIKNLTGGHNDTTMVLTLLVFAGIVLVTYEAIKRLTQAPYGRVLRAIRADDRVTAALGKNAFQYKMESFVFGAALAGLAGSLLALYNGAVSPVFFTLNITVLVWIGMLIGGAGNNRAVLGGLAIIMALRVVTRFLNEAAPVTKEQFIPLRLILIGFILVAMVRFRPEGVWGNADELGVSRRDER